MALDHAANFVRGNTDASVSPGDTTISVNDASIYPDPSTNGEYNLVLWDVNNYALPYKDPDVEIVRVTGRDTTNNDLTVTRAQESTSDVSHPSGSALQLSPTAKMFGDIDTALFDGSTVNDNAGLVADAVDTFNISDGLVAREIGSGQVRILLESEVLQSAAQHLRRRKKRYMTRRIMALTNVAVSRAQLHHRKQQLRPTTT